MSAELRLRTRIIDDAEREGFWASNVNDRFVSAKPDLRLSRTDVGQMDFELKILGCAESTIASGREVLSGVTKLQEIELRKMNQAGAPAVGLILIPEHECFVFCNFKEFSPAKVLVWGRVPYKRLPLKDPCVNFEELFRIAHLYRYSIGYPINGR